MKLVLPTYRTLQETGQIEVSTSPYFHPILPLISTRFRQTGQPRYKIPGSSFSHPEDAVEQLRLAVESHERCFGEKPTGLWPSEGAVSREVLELVAGMGNFKWLASDEGILALSLGQWVYRDPYGHVTNPRMLYRPYVGTNGLSMVFRDHLLSDRIGFVYRNMPGCDAANDLMHRLHEYARIYRMTKIHIWFLLFWMEKTVGKDTSITATFSCGSCTHCFPLTRILKP